MAELDALLRGKPQDASKCKGVPRAAPAYLDALAVDLRLRAVARAAHARECRARLAQQRKATTRTNRQAAAAHAREVRSARKKEYEHAQVVEALSRGLAKMPRGGRAIQDRVEASRQG
jgi:uncharacterized protein YlxW (UPF0749 family)